MRPILKDKKGIGFVTGLMATVVGIIVITIVMLLISSTLDTSGILTDDSTLVNNKTNAAFDDMRTNFTSGLDNVSEKIPTILLVSAVVILFGAIAILVKQSRQVTGGSGGL